MAASAGIGSGNQFLLNQDEFGDWLMAQGGNVSVLVDLPWSVASDLGPFQAVVNADPVVAATVDVWQVTVRAVKMVLDITGVEFIDVPIGTWWFVGKAWTGYFDTTTLSQGFVTAYAIA